MRLSRVWEAMDDSSKLRRASSVDDSEGSRVVKKIGEAVGMSPASFVISARIEGKGLMNLKSLLVVGLWYTFSFSTLFLNKYILDVLHADVFLFTLIHMAVAALLGYLNMYCPCYMYDSSGVNAQKKDLLHRPPWFYRHVAALGLVRVLVVFLSLMSIKTVALSFMETVKSSAPMFTVILSFLVLRESNGIAVQLSLFPIMFGLILCSAYEISFTWIGFLAVNGANFAECLKFVMSKTSLSNELHKMTPSEFQLNTCGMGCLIMLPMYLIASSSTLLDTKLQTILVMILNAVLFHFQTMMAWVLMEFLSPVTHSVCNTVKCALAVWISVPIFGNEVTLMSGVGSMIVLGGVFLYNRARSYEQRVRGQHLLPSYNDVGVKSDSDDETVNVPCDGVTAASLKDDLKISL